jgi:hypothetical protein
VVDLNPTTLQVRDNSSFVEEDHHTNSKSNRRGRGCGSLRPFNDVSHYYFISLEQDSMSYLLSALMSH